MKYFSKSQAIEVARELGSTAKTFRGAAKYLIAAAADSRPLEFRGEKSAGRSGARAYRLNRRADKIAAALGLWGQADAWAEADRLNSARTKAAAIALVATWPYRRSYSLWAGGKHIVRVRLADTPRIESGSDRVWSANRKWSGCNSWAHLYVSRRTLALFPNLRTPDGLILIDAEKIGPREYRISWLEQSRGFELRPVAGYLIRGYHVAAKTVESARKKAAIARRAAAGVAADERSRLREIRNFDKIWVGVDDSLRAGNCKPATEVVAQQLREKFGIIGGIRADELLRFRDDAFTRRAVWAATARHSA